MANTATLVVKIVSDAADAQRGLQEAGGGFQKFAGTATAALAAVGIGAFVKSTVDAASALQQSMGGAEAVFGEFADTVVASSKRASDAVGLSASKYQELATVIGSQLKNAGTPFDQLAGQTDQLITLGADLAATFGGSVSDAVSAVSSLMRGERDPIERYGVSINQAAIDAYKAANGLSELTGEAEAQANAQAALAIMYDQTAAAQGRFAAEGDTLAGSQARLTSAWENMQASLGQILLPLFTVAAQVLGELATWAVENETAFNILAVVLGVTAAAMWALNIAMAANPIGLVIIAIAALIAIIVLIVTNWDLVVAAFASGAEQIGGFIASIGDWFMDVFASIGRWWDDLLNSFSNGFDQLIGWVRDAIGWLGSLIGMNDQATRSAPVAASVAGAAAAAVPAARFAAPAVVPAANYTAAGISLPRRRAADPSGGDVNITVEGALDPNAVARQIRAIMTRYGRNTGALASGGGPSWR